MDDDRLSCVEKRLHLGDCEGHLSVWCAGPEQLSSEVQPGASLLPAGMLAGEGELVAEDSSHQCLGKVNQQ